MPLQITQILTIRNTCTASTPAVRLLGLRLVFWRNIGIFAGLA